MANILKNNQVIKDVIKSLAIDALQDVNGVSLPSQKQVSVSILPNERVAVDMTVYIEQNYTVPKTVATLQENVKKNIEGATRYIVHSINVEVANVIMA